MFTMRETLANLTQAMEQIATAAESNQKQIQRDNSIGMSSLGLNSQVRAAVKNLSNEEKAFNKLIKSLQEQFSHYKELAMPPS